MVPFGNNSHFFYAYFPLFLRDFREAWLAD